MWPAERNLMNVTWDIGLAVDADIGVIVLPVSLEDFTDWNGSIEVSALGSPGLSEILGRWGLVQFNGPWVLWSEVLIFKTPLPHLTDGS